MAFATLNALEKKMIDYDITQNWPEGDDTSLRDMLARSFINNRAYRTQVTDAYKARPQETALTKAS